MDAISVISLVSAIVCTPGDSEEDAGEFVAGVEELDNDKIGKPRGPSNIQRK